VSEQLKETEVPSELTLPIFREPLSAEAADRCIRPLPAPRYGFIVAGATLTMLGIAGLLTFGTYTERVTLSGYLAPESGVAFVNSPVAGQITQLIADGASVHRGVVLLTLAVRHDTPEGNAEAEQIAELRQEIGALQAHLTLTTRQAERQRVLAAHHDATPAAVDAADASVIEDTIKLIAARQQLAALEPADVQVVRAAVDGTVVLTGVRLGTSVVAGDALLQVVPNAPLEAFLYGPSRAIGKVRPGDSVAVRVAAYPYQHFGLQSGVVAAVSASAVSVSQIPFAVADLSAEPQYRIVISLDSQTVGGLPLRTAMAVEADVDTETRSLLGWTILAAWETATEVLDARRMGAGASARNGR
jgi:multidrug resistance efflux pump